MISVDWTSRVKLGLKVCGSTDTVQDDSPIQDKARKIKVFMVSLF